LQGIRGSLQGVGDVGRDCQGWGSLHGEGDFTGCGGSLKGRGEFAGESFQGWEELAGFGGVEVGGGVCKGAFPGAGRICSGGGNFPPPKKKYITGTGHLVLKARADHNSLTKT